MNAVSHKQQTTSSLCWRNVPSAWGGLGEKRISPAWSGCAEIPLPTIWSYPVPWSRCWRTGQSQANFPRREQDLCGHTTATKIIRREERGEETPVRDDMEVKFHIILKVCHSVAKILFIFSRITLHWQHLVFLHFTWLLGSC